ncbi:MAG: GTP 3',8-cyclase MoaA [Saprospiraceae bacterium]|nr:GTP 3',8-cyclase MoaA [Bacteroidia bacterium]MBT8229824.1 GTP 3',8-cyclase MoaA [Bacteroidia bacterium]NNF20844.1 GTP 3',8-cyclase MoaA [Saprospiraceae bacterium]NNK89209.1 GTP 3',8-cyclase MoaA [Saprospiraceae bacterium]
MLLKDNFGRTINYLRIGITDRCNLRCRYCMPEEGIDFSTRTEILRYEEILRLASIFSKLGINKIRLTGGEPFVRKDIAYLIKNLVKIIPDLYITTNATLLKENIETLRSSVKGLNISIDSLDRSNFMLITKRDSFDKVYSNILLCKQEGIPVKLNMVVLKGINDHEIPAFLNFGLQHKIEVRFIEAMPFNDFDGNHKYFISATEIKEIIKKHFPSIRQDNSRPHSAANEFILEETLRLGIIPAYSRTLCGSCNRVRLTPTGKMLTCLYSRSGLDLRELLRDNNISDNDISEFIKGAVQKKKKNGFLEEPSNGTQVFESMTTIGG